MFYFFINYYTIYSLPEKLQVFNLRSSITVIMFIYPLPACTLMLFLMSKL